MPSLDSRYPDLLPAPHDSALHQIVSRLDRAYGPENPNVGPPPEWKAHLAMTLAGRAAETTPRRARLRWFLLHPWRNTAFALVFTVAALGAAILGLALTDNPHYDQQSIPNVPVFAGTLFRFGHPIAQSATACGYTVEITQAYADANRTIMAVVIMPPPGRDFVALTGTGSATLRAITAKFPAGAPSPRLQSLDWWPGSMFHNRASFYFAFDTHQIAHGTVPLHLRLTLSGFAMIEELHNARPLPANWNMPSCERYSSTPWFSSPASASLPDRARAFLSGLAPGLIPSPIGRTVNIDRGYAISLTVPVDPLRVEIHPHESVTAGGVTLVLDRVVGTHSSLRVYLRRDRPGSILQNTMVILSEPSGGAESGAPLFGDWWTHSAPASRFYDFDFDGFPDTPPGAFTLTVRALPASHSPGMPWLAVKGGPWTFHFTLP